jgi:hypothetical protein
MEGLERSRAGDALGGWTCIMNALNQVPASEAPMA